VFAHGFRLMRNEPLASHYIIKADEYIHILFHSPLALGMPHQFYSNNIDNLISCLCLVGTFRIESGDFNMARQLYLQAFNILNMHVNDVNPEISHRVYANLSGMSRSTSDMSHWVDNAHLLGNEAGTSINRVHLSILYCSPSMLRDPKNKPLPPHLYIPEENTLRENDSVLYGRMLIEFDDTEEVINQEEAKRENDAVYLDYITSYKMIVYGCRSLVLAQCGCKDQALLCAEKSIHYAKNLKHHATYFAMTLGLAYALQVCKCLGNTILSNDGMVILESYRGFYPVVNEIINILSHDGNSNLFGGPTMATIKEENKIKDIPQSFFMIPTPGSNPYFNNNQPIQRQPPTFESNNQSYIERINEFV